MNDQQKATRIAGMTESAFGRPANWWTAWPALAVGLSAFLIAVYGTWWLPKRLPEQYAHALDQAQQQYQQIAEKTKTSGGQRLIDAAGHMDVIYSRLVDLEKNSPKRYWQWAEFQQAHAQLLIMALKDPALSLSPAIRERWTEQAQHFQSKSEEILDQLAARPSELQAKAMLHVAHRKYHQGVSEFGVREASELADNLSKALDSADSTAYDSVDKSLDHTASLTPDEIESGQLLLVQLVIEAAWQADARSKLTCDTTQLDQAWELIERFQSKQQSTAHRLEWHATRRLLMALTGKHFNVTENDVDAMDLGSDGRDSPQAWKSDLAKLQLTAIDGDWIEVANQLRSRVDPLKPVVTSGLARTICRLAVSPLASALQKTEAGVGEGEEVGERGVEVRERNDAERRATLSWAEDAGMGVLLAAQLGAHLPECSELLWECARLQAGLGTERIVVPAAIPQSIMSGQSGWLKHSLAALSATLDGQAAVAHTHLQLLSRTQGSPPLVARVALWRTQLLSADDAAAPTGELDQPTLEELKRLRELLGSVVQLEPNHGLNWFVLGTLQFRIGEFKAMRNSLDKARELLGDVPAIEQMLDAAEGIPSDQ
ncbi:MAG: hypothetical protein R3C09_03705 [Pirellulaceae bacterium]